MTARGNRRVPVKLDAAQAEALRAAVRKTNTQAKGLFQHFASEAERAEHQRQVEQAQRGGSPF